MECQFKKNHWWEGIGRTRHKRYRVDVLDVPGERFFDVEIHQREAYGDWCDEVDRRWEKDLHPAMERYRRFCLEAAPLDAAAVVAEYRKTLAELVAAYRPSITPSTFRLNLAGEPVRGRSADEILDSAAKNPCGATMENQFAPLSRNVRNDVKNAELRRLFSHNYQLYWKQVTTPLFRGLLRCNRLVILVDIPQILASVVGVDSDQNHMTKETLKTLVHRCFGGGRVRKVAFAATKADTVALQDNQRLSDLLGELARPQQSHLNGITPERFVLSAVKSTAPSDAPAQNGFAWLHGRTQFDLDESGKLRRRAPTEEKVDYQVSRLPETWPDTWKAGDYSFPAVYPEMPKARFAVPRMDNLNNLFKFIIQ